MNKCADTASGVADYFDALDLGVAGQVVGEQVSELALVNISRKAVSLNEFLDGSPNQSEHKPADEDAGVVRHFIPGPITEA